MINPCYCYTLSNTAHHAQPNGTLAEVVVVRRKALHMKAGNAQLLEEVWSTESLISEMQVAVPR